MNNWIGVDIKYELEGEGDFFYMLKRGWIFLHMIFSECQTCIKWLLTYNRRYLNVPVDYVTYPPWCQVSRGVVW